MNLHKHPLAALVAAFALGFSMPSFAADAVTDAQIAAARTPADHEAIARAYDSEAVAAEAKASAHEHMAKTYRTGGTPKGNSIAMTGHCERLASSYRAAATEYRALAAEHRKLATSGTR